SLRTTSPSIQTSPNEADWGSEGRAAVGEVTARSVTTTILRPPGSASRGGARAGRSAAGTMPPVRSVSPGARGRRTWPQRLILSLNVLLVLAALATAAGIGYSYDKVGSIP